MKNTSVAALFVGLLSLASFATAASKSDQDASAQIDRIIAKDWKAHDVKPNPLASDEVFLRRVYLDVTGRIPSYDETQAFLNSKAKDKRAKLIDDLLASEGYVNHFFNYWADILRINNNQGGGQNIVPHYVDYVRDSLAENVPYDEFVRNMLTAQGQAADNGAIGYTYRDRGMPLDHMANTVRIFLGTRLECAQCHNHPFDKWTQMDFYEMAAFSYGMNTNGQAYGNYNDVRQLIRQEYKDNNKKRQDMDRAFREIMRPIRNNNRVEYQDRLPQLPHDYQYADAKPKEKIEPGVMFGAINEIENADKRLDAYADWMTSTENARFTTVIANRLWKKMMGVGLFEPVDELMDNSEPTNAELMNFLEGEMMANNYDMKAFLRMILNSKVYQREASQQEIALGDVYHYPGPLLRRMSAEQIWDSIVALVNPKPEEGDWKRAQQQELRLYQNVRMQSVVENKSKQELLELTKQIANYQDTLQDETNKLTKKAQELREAGNREEANKVARQANQLRNKLRSRVTELVYEPDLKKSGVVLASMELPNGDSMDVTAKMVSSNGAATSAFRKMQDEMQQKMVDEELDTMGVEDEKERKDYFNMRRSSSRYLRAAHLSSPAPNGHFLRMFGQSDRETIENASLEASVPQALNLMNGPDFPQVTGNNSYLNWNLRNIETLEDKIDVIYLSMLSRKPTEAERNLILSAREQRGDKLIDDVVFAVMNGQEFLFVQ